MHSRTVAGDLRRCHPRSDESHLRARTGRSPCPGALRTINTACAILISAWLAWGQATPAPAAPPAGTPPAEKPVLVLIDPAHGGSDPGALLTPSVSEKEVTLAVARR